MESISYFVLVNKDLDYRLYTYLDILYTYRNLTRKNQHFVS